MSGDASPRVEGQGRSRVVSRMVAEWLALAAFLASLSVFVAWELGLSRDQLETTHRNRLKQQAHIVEKMLSTRLQATSNAIDALRADAPALLSRPDGVARLNERMQVMVSSMVGVRTFLLVNATGIAAASNRKELTGIDFHDGERYRAIRARPDPTILHLSPPFMTPLGHWALSLGKAVLDGHGAFNGYVLAIIDPEYFNLLLDSTRYAPDMTATLIHSGGKIIYRNPDHAGAIGMNLAEMSDSAFAGHLRSGMDVSSWMGPLKTTGDDSLIVLQSIRPQTSVSEGYLIAAFSRGATAIFSPWQKNLRDRVILLVVAAMAGALALSYRQRRRTAMALAEAELARSARLAALGTLVAGVAHEVNNPLTILLASAGAALEDVHGFQESVRKGAAPDRERVLRHSGQLLELLEEIGTSAERISLIVKDLSLLGRPVEQKERVRLETAVTNALQHVPAAIAERAVIRADLVDVPDVMASAGQLSQVVTNLVTNAALAFPDGHRGEIVVHLGPGAPGKVRLEVTDDGPGIAPEILGRIFEPFFTTRQQQKGTGLGLSICNAIVEGHGGHLTVKSVVGQGATFRVELPAVVEAASTTR